MDSLEYLVPVNPSNYKDCLQADFSLGKEIRLDSNWAKQQQKIALVGSTENEQDNTMPVRRALYQLKAKQWNVPIYDFGNLVLSQNQSDNLYAIQQLTQELVQNQFLLVFLSPNLVHGYAVYRAYDQIKKPMNLAWVDAKIPIKNASNNLVYNNLLNRIIQDQPQNLLEFVQLGYQEFYHSEQELRAIDYMNLDCISLGKLSQNLLEIEASLREIDLCLLNLDAIAATYFGSNQNQHPNGFTNREICAVAKYAGLSNHLSSFFIGNYHNKNQSLDYALLAQIIWYFVDGVNHRSNQEAIQEKDNYERYYVQLPEQEIIFLHNKINHQWWIELHPNQQKIPCTKQDYLLALENKIPDRYWRAYKKFY